MALFAEHDGQLIRAQPEIAATCPTCRTPMIPKCGQIVIWHWAHITLSGDCDEWSEGESMWHLQWKLDLLQAGCRIEVPIVKFGEHHRADAVLPNGRIIELQSDYLSVEAIEARERFYGSMLWLYRAHWWNDDRVFEFGGDSGDGGAFRWKHPALSMLTHRRPVFWDTTTDGEQVVVGVRLWDSDRSGRRKVYGKLRTGETPGEWIDRVVTVIGTAGQPVGDASNGVVPACRLCDRPSYKGDVHPCCAINEQANPGTPCPHCAESRALGRVAQRRDDERIMTP